MLTMREMNVGEAFEAGYANEVSLRRNGAVLKKDGYLFEITRKGVNGIRVTRIK